MPDQNDIHRELSGFKKAVISILTAAAFWDIEGPYKATDVLSRIPVRARKAFRAASIAKNTNVLSILKETAYPPALSKGISRFNAAYPARAVAAKSAQEYMASFVEVHGGELITQMGRTDQKKLVNFVWANAGENERPLARRIDEEPHLRYILDQGNHREETIIRTEEFRAISYGTNEAAIDSGFTKKGWHTAGDDKVRDEHRENEAQGEIDIHDAFQNGENYPGEKSINCRCRIEYA